MFGSAAKQDLYKTDRLQYIPVEIIASNPLQPRKRFEENALIELSDSIRNFGLLQPLTVRKNGAEYELVAGERRLRAAKIAGLSKVPCIILDIKAEDSALLAMIENLQRQDLDCFEEAEGIETIIRTYKLTQEQVAEKIGKSQPAVANKLRLLRFSEAARILMRQHNLTERHARALLRLPEEKAVLSAINTIVSKRLNVSQTDRYIDQILQAVPPKNQSKLIVFKDLRIFINSINKTIEIMQNSGVKATARRNESSENIIYTIVIPKVN